MTVDLTRWKEIDRRELTVTELAAYIAGNTPCSADRSFDIVIHTKVEESVQIIYEKVPYNGQ